MFANGLGRSDTVGSVISTGMYFLAKHPRVYKKLQKLLDEKLPDRKFNHATVLSVEYLDAIIMEALRLYPPAILGIPRQIPKEGMTIAGRFIPGDVVVSVPPYTMNRHPDFWLEPDEFIPERWTVEGEHLAKDRSVCVPFSMGKYTFNIQAVFVIICCIY
jgi:cytochrome P450